MTSSAENRIDVTHQRTDVLIVGTEGAGGMRAAIEAQKAGSTNPKENGCTRYTRSWPSTRDWIQPLRAGSCRPGRTT